LKSCVREVPEARVAGLVPVGNLRGDRMPVNRAACVLSARVPAGKAVMREGAVRSLRTAEVSARLLEKIPRAVAVRR